MEVNANNLYRKFGITEEEVDEWAENNSKIPSINKYARALSYLANVKKVGDKNGAIQPFGLTIPDEYTPISAIELGKMQKIHGIAVAKVRCMPYMGCPQCQKKLDENSVCGKCGQEVRPIEYYWEDWHVCSTSDDANVVASFSPVIVGSGLNIENKEVFLVGVLESNQRNGVTYEKFSVKKILQGSDVKVPGVSKPSKGVEKPVSGAAKEDSKKSEAKVALTNLLKAFNPTPRSNLENWHKQNGFSVPLDELIKSIGAKVEGQNVFAPE